MTTWRRMSIWFQVTIAVAIATLIYYRVGQDHLFDMVTNGSGPFVSSIGLLAGVVPVALAIIELGVTVWVIAGGVQEERGVARGPRR